MSLPTSLSSRLREVLLDGQWIANTNFRDQIEKLNWQEATTKPGELNTIAALTFHISYYLGGVLEVLQGGELRISDRYSFDMPPVSSEADWKLLCHEFIRLAEACAQAVAALPEEKLSEPFADPKYGDYQRNIEGLIEHGYYHLGQVSLLRKMILAGKGA